MCQKNNNTEESGPESSSGSSKREPRQSFAPEAEDVRSDPLAPSQFVGMYPLYRPPAKVETPYKANDRTFPGPRLDGQEIDKADYRHCTFVDASFKETDLCGCTFLDCTFMGCYFRRTTLQDCRFTGCRFYDCQFPNTILHGCDFRYSQFKSCQVSFSEMEHSLPSPPNLKEQLCRNLAIQSALLGLANDARRYRKSEVSAREEHLWNGVVGESQWYRDHFSGLRRFRAFGQWLLSKMNGFLWGYGDRLSILLRNLLLAVAFIFPTLYWWSGGLMSNDGLDLDWVDYLYFSISNALPVSAPSAIYASSWLGYTLVILESVFGAVTLALFAAYVFRWSLQK